MLYAQTSLKSAKQTLQKSVLTLLMIMCFAIAWPSQQAEARAGYAKWLKHGDYYSVSGSFAGYRGTLTVQVKWRGNRFVVSTPLGTFPLKRSGSGVKFRVNFQNAWAAITWIHTRATVIYKGQRATTAVKKLAKRKANQSRNGTLK